MSNFDDAVDFVLKNEGGFVDSPSDSGGATNYGISLRFLKSLSGEKLRKYGIFKNNDELDIGEIKDLTLSQAKLIYRDEFWEGNHFDQIDCEFVCAYIFDMFVNHGSSMATKLVQRASWAATGQRGYLHDDGLMGEKTIGAINSCSSELWPCIIATRAEYYRLLVALYPKNEVFLDGWLNRCYSVST